MIYLFDELETMTEADYAAAYELLFDARKQKTARYRFERDRWLSAFAYVLLLYGLKCEERPVESKPKFAHRPYGKPYFLCEALSNVFFNISHCAEGVVCGISDGEIGVDIEGYVQDMEKIKGLVLHPNEQHLFDGSKEANELFTQLWTIKEAYTKMKGCGLSTEITELDFSDFADQREYDDGTLLTQRFDRYVVSAFGCPKAVRKIRKVSAREMKELIESL